MSLDDHKDCFDKHDVEKNNVKIRNTLNVKFD